MPSVVKPQSFTSYPASLSGVVPGNADVGGHFKRDVRKFVDSQFPGEVPIQTRIKNRDTSDQLTIEWGTHSSLGHQATLKTTVINSDTTFSLQTGQAAYFTVNQSLAIYQLDANGKPKWSTREVCWVTGVDYTLDNLTVVRARGNTTAQGFTGGAVGIGALIEVLPTAVAEGDDFQINQTVFGDFYKNYFQLIQKGHKISEEGNTVSNQEFQSGNHIARLMKDAAQRARLELEKAIVQGTADRGTNASPKRPSMMAGILEYIPSANVTDLNGFAVSPYDIEIAGASLWRTVGNSAAKAMLMSMDTARMFDGMMNRYRRAGMQDDSVNLAGLKSFETRFGDFEIIPTRWVPEGVIAGVDFSKLALITFEGMDWTEKEHATDGAYLWRSIYAKKSLRVENPEVMWLLHNFNTDLRAYGRVF